MKVEQLLEELERVASRVGARVTYDIFTGEHVGSGGLCRVKGEYRVIIDRRATASEKLGVLAQALAGFDLEAVYLSPEARELLERRGRGLGI
jgi:hypothetical protein